MTVVSEDRDLPLPVVVVDLDGPLLLREDRDHGLDFTDGMIHAPTAALWG